MASSNRSKAAVARALAPETTTGPTPNGTEEPNPDTTAANGAEPERNGAATEVGTQARPDPAEAEAAPAPAASMAAPETNGLATEMQVAKGEAPEGGVLINGARAERGTGTDTPDDSDQGPDYPATTLVRKSPRSAPLEPADVKKQADPSVHTDLTSTDATAAAAGQRSMAGENMTRLLDRKGNEVKASDIFESVESNPMIRLVKKDVVEEFTVHRQTTPLTRLLFNKGDSVPVVQAEQFVALHG